ncbi:hypothetical protein OEZ85_006771 [Tetradesmus obliquus]|uniref:Uncharacterized protein n=1 Tax=Tetradesmus obliquus TaxID=3088 RepID=A0ABY8TVL3_TETOB|nr:hypothetical protein OEZ85_006771 [Tetradesmus obliquus]
MTALMLNKRKRSSDAVSDSGTCKTEQTEASTPRRGVDEKSQLLAQKREQFAQAKLQLEEQIRQAQEQKQHVAVQLEQLEGCESSRDNLGISDLRAQLQAYEQQEQQAQQQLAEQQRQFEAAVSDILGIPAGQQQEGQLSQAVQEQQQLQEAQVQQLAVEQQLAQPGFAVTDSSKHQAKKARQDRISQSPIDTSYVSLLNSAPSDANLAIEIRPAGQDEQEQCW